MEQPKPDNGHQLVEGYYRPLLRYFTRRVGNSHDAQDLTQDVFARLNHYVGRDLDSPAALVFTIAANVLRDWHKRRGSSLGGRDKFNSELGVDEVDPLRILVAREMLSNMVLALDELGERTRAIFILFRLEKMRQRDIAESLGITVSAVEKHIAKASAHLVERMNHYER